ncbi:MAG: HAD family hydrolase [Bdellovibrionota bacterium]|nr:HAD family hydrolase [Pseudomonadota bacterium]MDY6090653.1 HAD family hydrolase [Bdellovibrionota bacterium]
MTKLIQMAICYDFDGTLSPKNMQEYGFMKKLQTTPLKFWAKSNKFAKENFADTNAAYMKLMIEEANKKGVPFTKNAFLEYGASVKFYKGVEGWFERINEYGKRHGVKVRHFIISSGLREIIKKTAIGKYFEEVFASSYMYDKQGNPIWPANVVNYTSKTQYLFRINKGCLDINDNIKVNARIEKDKREIPFENMVFIGDGETDIPAMKVLRSHGGHSVAVYNPKKVEKQAIAKKLINDNRVNIITPADYRENQIIDKYIKALINKIKADNDLANI